MQLYHDKNLAFHELKNKNINKINQYLTCMIRADIDLKIKEKFFEETETDAEKKF